MFRHFVFDSEPAALAKMRLVSPTSWSSEWCQPLNRGEKQSPLAKRLASKR